MAAVALSPSTRAGTLSFRGKHGGSGDDREVRSDLRRDVSCKKGQSRKIIDRERLSEFWRQVDSGGRRGVYVFGIRASRGWKPLYVGQTRKQTFKARIDQHTQTNGDFNNMLKGIKKGTPVLFLLGSVGRGKTNKSAIDELEIEFINYAFARNRNLHNDRGIRKPKYVIKGFGSRGKPATDVGHLKTIVGY